MLEIPSNAIEKPDSLFSSRFVQTRASKVFEIRIPTMHNREMRDAKRGNAGFAFARFLIDSFELPNHEAKQGILEIALAFADASKDVEDALDALEEAKRSYRQAKARKDEAQAMLESFGSPESLDPNAFDQAS